MKNWIKNLLEKINLSLSKRAQSRPSYQVLLVVDYLLQRNKNKKLTNILDVGGGFDASYKGLLANLAMKYTNMEIEKGKNVDVVGSIYKIPFKKSTFDVVTSFMVLEHLAEPLLGLKECNRILKKNGYLALTTVQYWQTHNYPGDYFRYTRQGLEYLCKKAGFKIIQVYSHGGPWLVIFHAIEINLRGPLRLFYSIAFYKLFNFLDWVFFKHYDKRVESDSVGWTVIAQKI